MKGGVKIMILIPKSTDFKAIAGRIDDGVPMRCGCQCHCPGGGQRCSGTCANCKKYVDPVFIAEYSVR